MLESKSLRKSFPSNPGIDPRLKTGGTDDKIPSKKENDNTTKNPPSLKSFPPKTIFPSSQNVDNLDNIKSNERPTTIQKLTSGAGFRAPFQQKKCEQCELLELSLNKSKETTRSLKLQISRLEENSIRSRRKSDNGTEGNLNNDTLNNNN